MTGSATVTPSVASGPGPTTAATRLRLRPGVHVAPVPHGLSVVGRGQAFVVPGSDELATTWNALFPLLHAGADRDRLVSGPAPDDAGLLLEVLDQAGLLLDADAARALPDELAGRFPRTLNYLEAFAEDPCRSLLRVRECSVAVEGSGVAAFAAARALASFGFGSLVIEDAEISRRLAQAAAEAGCDLSGNPAPDLLITEDSLTAPSGPSPWLGLLLCGELSFVSPVAAAPGMPDLLDVVARFTRRTGREPAVEPTSPVAAALAGNLAALQALSWRCRLADPERPEARLVHTGTLRVQRYQLSRPGLLPLPATERSAGAVTGPARPTGTLAPAPAAYLPPADDWLLAVTDPASGLLDRPAPVTVEGTAEHWAQAGDRSGRLLFGCAAGPDEAARAVVASLARELVPERPERLWSGSGEPVELAGEHAEPAVIGTLVRAAGYSRSELLRDAARRLLLSCWADPGPRSSVLVESSARRAVPLGERGAELAVFEVAGTGLRVAVLSRERTPLALSCAATAELAAEHALRWSVLATLAATATAGWDPIAVDPGEDWDPGPVLAALAGPGRVLTGRWLIDPVLDEQLQLGWVALAVPELLPASGGSSETGARA